MHDHEPFAGDIPSGGAGPLTFSAVQGPAQTAPPTAPDDCFCCSHYVYPQARYQAVPAYAFVAAVEADHTLRPHSPASQLYHPPLA